MNPTRLFGYDDRNETKNFQNYIKLESKTIILAFKTNNTPGNGKHDLAGSGQVSLTLSSIFQHLT